jgi:hypothetical protein
MVNVTGFDECEVQTKAGAAVGLAGFCVEVAPPGEPGKTLQAESKTNNTVKHRAKQAL